MYLVGHVALAILIWFIYERFSKTRNDLHKLLIAIGSMLPDFLDKPIGSLIFNTGRWLGHSIIFQLFVLTTLLTINSLKFNGLYKKEIIVLYVGAVIHLIGDFPGITTTTLFWPFLGPFEPTGQDSFLFGFTNPIVIFEEILGLFTIIAIGIYEKWDNHYWKIVFLVIVSYLVLYFIVFLIFVGF